MGKPGETRRRKAAGLRRVPRAMSAGLHFGKPLETMGRKVLEAAASKGFCANPSALCPSDCDFSKPRETVGPQSYGAYGMNRTCPVPLRQPDCRTLCVRKMQRKE